MIIRESQLKLNSIETHFKSNLLMFLQTKTVARFCSAACVGGRLGFGT